MGPGGRADSDVLVVTQLERKRPDAWAIHWGKRCLPILEFTRPIDRDAPALQDTDALRDGLARLLRGWTVEIQAYTMGIRGSHDPDRCSANLNQFGLTAARTETLIRDLTSQALVELTDIYSVRYAALQNRPHAHNG